MIPSEHAENMNRLCLVPIHLHLFIMPWLQHGSSVRHGIRSLPMTASPNICLHLIQIPPYGTLRSSMMMTPLLFQVCDSLGMRLPVQIRVKFVMPTFKLKYTPQTTLWIVTRMGLVESLTLPMLLTALVLAHSEFWLMLSNSIWCSHPWGLMHDEVPPIKPAEAAWTLLDPLIQAEVNSECILTITHLMYGSPGAQVPIKAPLYVSWVEQHSVAPFGLRFSLSFTERSCIFYTIAAAWNVWSPQVNLVNAISFHFGIMMKQSKIWWMGIW